MAATSAVLAANLIIADRQAEKQEQFQERQEAIKASAKAANRFEKRKQAIRQARIRRAQMEQAAENTGTAESSGLASGLGGLQTQLSSLDASMNQEDIFSAEMYDASRDFARSQRRATTATSLVNAGFQGYKSYQKMQQLDALQAKYDEILKNI